MKNKNDVAHVRLENLRFLSFFLVYIRFDCARTQSQSEEKEITLK